MAAIVLLQIARKEGPGVWPKFARYFFEPEFIRMRKRAPSTYIGLSRKTAVRVQRVASPKRIY
jgi:hypothetical protein